ncbi:MAG TPA: hypothetical protein VES20_11525 [Bryobacteraceae bacterium]|nr:hypothetical protein [Bryobacteraceae bacterium]
MEFQWGSRITKPANCIPYERTADDPVFRPLRIFAVDPLVSQFEGAIATVQVPYEPLKPGPVGSTMEVLCHDGYQENEPADLDNPRVLIENGYAPSVTNPKFHHQMTYAVASLICAAFRKALGRQILWGFDAPRLRIRPHVPGVADACYDKATGELRFGYSKDGDGRYVFAALSHDVIAHECAHALLDALRTHLNLRSNPDVEAFHEGFADLVALLQHFTYPEVVRAAIQKAGGNLARASLLTEIASVLGYNIPAAAERTGVRSGVRVEAENVDDPHTRGSRLVVAVFDAYLTLFRRKTAPFIRLATGGTGVLPPGALPYDLVEVLAKRASRLAEQILRICIRAIDYCPPVDLELGEFLRAMITADRDVAPNDPYGYREAFIDAFRKQGIYPSGVSMLSEDALVWGTPEMRIPSIDDLTFAQLQFRGDPATPASLDEIQRQATALGRIVTDRRYAYVFGLSPSDQGASPASIESIRTARRIGPYESVVFDLVAEVTQVRVHDGIRVYGGSTIIIDPEGRVRYSIAKNVLSRRRWEAHREYQHDAR